MHKSIYSRAHAISCPQVGQVFQGDIYEIDDSTVGVSGKVLYNKQELPTDHTNSNIM